MFNVMYVKNFISYEIELNFLKAKLDMLIIACSEIHNMLLLPRSNKISTELSHLSV